MSSNIQTISKKVLIVLITNIINEMESEDFLEIFQRIDENKLVETCISIIESLLHKETFYDQIDTFLERFFNEELCNNELASKRLANTFTKLLNNPNFQKIIKNFIINIFRIFQKQHSHENFTKKYGKKGNYKKRIKS